MSFATPQDSWGAAEQGRAGYGGVPAAGRGGSYQNPAPHSDDHHDVEYQRAHQLVADNVKQMTSEFNTLSKMAQAIGTAKDSSKFREQVYFSISPVLALLSFSRCV